MQNQTADGQTGYKVQTASGNRSALLASVLIGRHYDSRKRSRWGESDAVWARLSLPGWMVGDTGGSARLKARLAGGSVFVNASALLPAAGMAARRGATRSRKGDAFTR